MTSASRNKYFLILTLTLNFLTLILTPTLTRSPSLSLSLSLIAGQAASISGISYWTSDIGGYQGLDVSNRRGFDLDLLMRWFQFGAFCGVFRTHGYRAPVNRHRARGWLKVRVKVRT